MLLFTFLFDVIFVCLVQCTEQLNGDHLFYGCTPKLPPPLQDSVRLRLPMVLPFIGCCALVYGAMLVPCICTARLCVHSQVVCAQHVQLSDYAFLLLSSLSSPCPSFLNLFLCSLPASPLYAKDVCGLGGPFVNTMAKVNMIYFNVRGLHAPGKRHNLFRERNCLQGDIVLQETHTTYFFSPSYPIWYYSLLDVSKAKGVAIIFHGGTSFSYENALVDECGRNIFLGQSG